MSDRRERSVARPRERKELVAQLVELLRDGLESTQVHTQRLLLAHAGRAEEVGRPLGRLLRDAEAGERRHADADVVQAADVVDGDLNTLVRCSESVEMLQGEALRQHGHSTHGPLPTCSQAERIGTHRRLLLPHDVVPEACEDDL